MRTSLHRILVEGVDCAGKSTLVKELKNHFGFDALTLGHQDTPQFDRYLKAYATHDRTVFERGHLSEAIYSQVFDRSNPFEARERQTLDTIVNQTMLLVLALPNLETAKARYKARKHEFQIVHLDQLEKANLLFEQQVETFPHCLIYRSESWEELSTLLTTIQQRLTT